MHAMQERELIRAEARVYEQHLPQARRKQLGQFFTGVPLGKVLAHLAVQEKTRTVLDPMAGHGDLLDAVWEAAAERGIALHRLDGMEVDPETAKLANHRLQRLRGRRKRPATQVIECDAFDPASLSGMGGNAYDLVIANPPYVRYQSRKIGVANDPVRAGLKRIVERTLDGPSSLIWSELVRSYSGLADLSVPAWLLAAAMVKPGGRLALVVPATWRTRNYADVVRYLLLRCYEVEVIVEDQQPGWFSDALVRTHLIVARRLDDATTAIPVGARSDKPVAPWLEIAPEAAARSSLVGKVFRGEHPELKLAQWLRSGKRGKRKGLAVRNFDARKEWAELREAAGSKAWLKRLEGSADESPSRNVRSSRHDALPDVLCELLTKKMLEVNYSSLQQLGIEAGQGLRTGCNAFFYVSALEQAEGDNVLVEAAGLFGRQHIPVPKSVLKTVLRRQSELKMFVEGKPLAGRVLDLRGWAIAEDVGTSGKRTRHRDLFDDAGSNIIPEPLAAFVRRAARTRLKDDPDAPLIPELSAVRTNARLPKSGSPARFWYTLPNFAPRHRPAAFVPRIVQDTPWVEANAPDAFLVDANFSTFWTVSGGWSGTAIKALLNSSWCRAYMEATGTPMGGGALKLEATHLKRLLLPPLPKDAAAQLHKAGRCLNGSINANIDAVNAIVLKVLSGDNPRTIKRLASALDEIATGLSAARQRGRA